MSEASGWGIILANIIVIGAAAGAFIFSGFTYRHNQKLEQIKIAREQMDRISAKYNKLLEVKIESLVNEEVSSPLVFLSHVEEILKECDILVI